MPIVNYVPIYKFLDDGIYRDEQTIEFFSLDRLLYRFRLYYDASFMRDHWLIDSVFPEGRN